MPFTVKTPKTVNFILIPAAIVINVVLILGGYFCFTAGLVEIAIIIWILIPILDAFLIWFIIWLRKFLENVVFEDPPPNPPCVIFLGMAVSVAIFLSAMNILLIH